MAQKRKAKHEKENPEIQKARNFVDKGDFDEALKIYEDMINKNSDDADALCNIGLIYYQKGDLKKAEETFLKCLEKDSGIQEAYFNLGRLYHNNREFEKALTYYKEVVVNNPDDGITYYYMGECARAVGRLDDAIAFLDEAIRLQPNNLEVGVTLATLYIEKRDYQKAEDVLRVTLVSHTDVEAIHYSLGLILKEQGKIESALAQFNKVVQLDDTHVQGFYELAECCMELGFEDQAEPFYAKASKLDPDFSEPALKLGDLYKKQGRENDAVIMYRHWIEMVYNSIDNFDPETSQLFREKALFVAGVMHDQGDMAEEAKFRQLANRVLNDTGECIKEKRGYDVSLDLD